MAQKKTTEFGFPLWHGDEPEGGTKPFGSITEKLGLVLAVFLIFLFLSVLIAAAIFIIFLFFFAIINGDLLINIRLDLTGSRGKKNGVVFLM